MSYSEGCRLRKDPDKNGIEEHKADKIFRPDKPIHKPSESLLTDFNGFSESLVWFALLLLAAIISLLLETIRSSSLFNVQQWFNYLIGSQTGRLESSTIYALLYLCVPAIVSLFLEKGLAKNKIPQKIGMIAHILNICQLLILPGVVIYCDYSTFSGVGSMYICVFYFIQVLKIWSYVHVNYWCRVARDSSDAGLIKQHGLNFSPNFRGYVMSDSGSCRLRKDPDMNGIEKHKPNKIFRPDKPIHKASETIIPHLKEFPGYVLWAAFLLLGAAISILLENQRSGARINFQQWHNYFSGCQSGRPESSLVYALMYSCVPAIISLLLEKGLAENKIPQKIGMIAHILNISQLFCLPGILIYSNSSTFSVVGSLYICIVYFIQVLKIWSYVHVNYWCRIARDSSDAGQINQNGLNSSQTRTDKDSLVEYPDNLVFKDMAYYFLAPTVCYELNIPRTNGIRKRFLISCLLEVIIITVLLLYLYDSMVEPMRTAIITHFNTNDLLKKIESYLKLFVPLYIFSIGMIYVFFKSYLNILAELMYFADRTFYLDWWNASNGRIFWKKWDVPIHRWFLRHIYLPLRDLGYSKNMGLLAAFFISGLFHEYAICAPLNISAYLLVIAFVSQVSVMDFTAWIEKHCGSKCGNVIVVLFYSLPVQILILFYYYKYVITHFGQSAIDSHTTI